MIKNFQDETNNENAQEYVKKITPHEYTWKTYKCNICGNRKKLSSIVLKLYSTPKCCGQEMECISSHN